MANSSLTDLLSVLNDCRLLETDQLNELASVLQMADPQPHSLRDELRQRGWLTAFQIERLMQGEGPKLALGQYVLLDLLGEGGMGQVYKARHRLMNRIVALKVIRQDQLSSEAAIQRFHREIRLTAQLSHPNVVIAHDADQVGGTHFFVMEYVDGTDLGKLVQQTGPMPVGQACDCIRQASLGLQHAHEKGLVHRDIKPSNLLLPLQQGTVKVLDLGLARLREEQAEPAEQLTRTGMVMGTPDYMAPEQGANSHLVDTRADIYSLGCTLYFLLTGRVLFPDCTLVEKLIKHRTDEPMPVQALRPEVSDELTAVLQRMTAKKAEDRYQTPAEAAAALAPLCAPVEPAAHFLPAARPDPNQVLPPTPPLGAPAPASIRHRIQPLRKREGGPLGEPIFSQATGSVGAVPPPQIPLRSTDGGRNESGSWTPIGLTDRLQEAPSGLVTTRRPRRGLLLMVSVLAGAGLLGLGAALLGPGRGASPSPQLAVHPGPDIAVSAIGAAPPTLPIDKPKPPPLRQGEQRLALVIGAGRFSGPELRPRPAADTDAGNLAAALEKQGFPRDNLRVLNSTQDAERQPLAANIRKHLSEIVQGRDPTDSLVIAWSGHAVQFPGENEAYLCPADARLADRTTLLPLSDVYRALGECKAGYKVLLLDVCRANPQADTARPRVELDLVARPQKQVPPPGVVVLFGCGAGEQGFDCKNQAGGVFFDAVARALNQKVDVEQFLREQVGPYVQQTYKETQTPLRIGTTAGTAPLASLQSLQRPIQSTVVIPMPPPTEKVGLIGRLEGHIQSVKSVAFLPDRPEALSCGFDYSMRLWNLDALQEMTTVKYDPNIEDLIWSIAVSGDGNRAVTGCGGKLEDGRVRLSFDNVLLVWNVRTGRVLKVLKGHEDAVVSVALSPGGRFAVSGSLDKTVRGWDLDVGRELFRCPGHKQPVMAVALNRDGDIVASASRDRTVRLWDARTGKPLRTLNGHQEAVTGVAFSPDGRRLVSSSFDKTCRLWDVATGEELGTFDGHTDSVWCVAFTPDGEYVLSGGADHVVRLWDVRGFKQIEVFKGHRATVTSVAVSADGQRGLRGLSGSDDQVVRYWALPKQAKP